DKSTSLDLEYQYWNRDYSTSSDYDSHQVKAILRKKYKYLTLEAGAGYHQRDFDVPGLEEIDMFTYGVGLSGQYPTTAVKPTSYFSLGAESNFNDSGAGNTYYDATRFELSAGHVFKRKIPFDIKASYQNSDYKTQMGLTPAGTMELRDDDTKNLEGSLGYILSEYLVFKAIAGYEDRDSNITGRDYSNNYLMARLDFVISLGRR
ncbi:MAG TPA: outer membrane beta-barrel protein, partial [Desulfatiglandales bacterium]|nr:outer membrane beta-barrel protein [Desulfatiglandales bacterium]